MEILRTTGKSIKNISILNTYASHSGYLAELINKYCAGIEAYLSLLPNNLAKIWRTAKNGELSWSNTNKQNVGLWTIGWKLENLNRSMLSDWCGQYDMVAINTFHIPKSRNVENLSNWHSNNRDIERQLGYILIEQRCRNWAKISLIILSQMSQP